MPLVGWGVSSDRTATLPRWTCVLSAAVVCLSLGTPFSAVGQDSILRQRIEKLARDLGSDSFDTRERATIELIRIGPPALEVLQELSQSSDREVRLRAVKSATVIRELQFGRQLQQFRNDPDPESEKGYGLPGWDAFRDRVGHGLSARRLFGLMQEQESDLLWTFEKDPEKIQAAINKRLSQSGDIWRNANGTFNLGSTTTLLFLLTAASNQVDETASATIQQYLSNSAFREQVRTGPHRQELKGMLSAWISSTKPTASTLWYSLYLELPEGMTLARKVLAETPPDQIGDPNLVNYAFFVCCRFGTNEEIPRIEPFLESKAPAGPALVIRRGNQIARPQIRDVALASLIQLEKLNPLDFGFDQPAQQTAFGFNLASLAFPDDQKRSEAIAKWRDYRKTSTRKPAGGEPDESDRS